MERRISIIISVLIAVLLAAAAVSLHLGAVNYSPGMLISALGDKTFAPEIRLIVLRIRLPRSIMALVVGGALAVAGVVFQGLFRNPLVEPYTLGVSGGAALGISLGFLLSDYLPAQALPLFGFAGAWLAVGLAYSIARRRRILKIPYLLLIGVMISFICSALIMLLLSLVNLSRFRAVIYWTMGSLQGSDPNLLWIVIPLILIGLLLSLTRAWTLNALALGEEGAGHLGLDIEREKRWLFFLGSLLAGTAVAAAGVIGFVGLLIPHILRLVIGGDHRSLIPASFLAGGIFLLICDTFARCLLAPIELPVGVITGIIGGILFIYLISRRGKP